MEETDRRLTLKLLHCNLGSKVIAKTPARNFVKRWCGLANVYFSIDVGGRSGGFGFGACCGGATIVLLNRNENPRTFLAKGSKGLTPWVERSQLERAYKSASPHVLSAWVQITS